MGGMRFHHFPLLLIPVLLYNVFAFLIFPDWERGFATASLFTIPMVSGAVFTFTVSAAITLMALVLLAAEVIKAARIGGATVTDHLLATILFVAVLLEFIFVRQAATSSFFVLLAVCFIDLICGFAVSLRTATRDISISERAF